MFDTLIRNGLVVDGLGGPRRRSDVGIVGDRLPAIGDLQGQEAGRIIDAAGLFVAPGFVDIHAHSDWTVLVDPRAESWVRQGTTTEVMGNCGFSWVMAEDPNIIKQVIPEMALKHLQIDWRTFDGYLNAFKRKGTAVNLVPQVGHGVIRMAVMGFDSRPPTPAELEKMKSLLAETLDQGAVGLSFGLQYAPGSNCVPDEMVALCQVAAGRNKLVTVHQRAYTEKYLDAIREALTMAQVTGARLQISHIPPHRGGPPPMQNWEQAIALIEKARSDGVEVNFDAHPYNWGMTLLDVVLPAWAFEGGTAKILERLQDPGTRERIKKEPKEGPFIPLLNQKAYEDLMLTYAPNSQHLIGKTFAEIGKELRKDPYDAALDILLNEGDNLQGAFWISRQYEEEVVAKVLSHPLAMAESDGWAMAVDGPFAGVGCHPRFFGWTARLLGYHVREQKRMTLEEAVRKITAFPADKAGLADRGRLVEGARADVVVFDLAGIRDNATYAKPQAYPSGFHSVLNNGQLVVSQGSHTGALPGSILRA